jgi:hypothetical protein
VACSLSAAGQRERLADSRDVLAAVEADGTGHEALRFVFA